MGRLKKLKKIRIHREGTHILWASFLLLLLINAALYWGIDCKIPFYVVAVASIVVYLLMVNFFRCPIRLFDNQDLCMLLQISKRTLQRYRSVGALPYKTLGKKTYYSEEDVLTFLSNHIKDFKKEDIAFYKARIHNFFHK